MMKTRKQLLEELVRNVRPPQQIARELAAFPWDSEQALVVLTRQHVTAVLGALLQNRLSAQDVQRWADALESREDIDYEAVSAEALSETIFELANPELTAELSRPEAERLLRKLA
jgi:hypothetical protein